MCADVKPRLRDHIQPVEHVELYIGPRMEPLEVARWMTAMQKRRPDLRFWIDGTNNCIKSYPKEECRCR